MSVQPLFTVVIPTLGRETLERTLLSIRCQPTLGLPDPEIIVVFDTFALEDVHAPRRTANLCERYGAIYAEHNAGCHDTGSPQLEVGFARARGCYILNCGDDDVYEPWAFPTMRQAIEGEPTRPLMFRTVLHPAPQRGDQRESIVLWQERRIERGRITGQCFLAPNVPEKLGRWVDDVTFMAETVEKWGSVGWRTEVISQCY